MIQSQRLVVAVAASVLASLAAASGASAAATADVPASPTFTRDVLPILQKNCQDCHRPEGLNLGGMVAPMALVTYDETRPWAKSIAKAVESKEMPPWHAAESQRGLFVDERYLSDAEIETIVAWVRAGAPQGDAAAAPPPVEFAANDGWHIGQPDLVLKQPVEYCMADETEDEYQYFEQTIGPDVLPHDRWIKAVEFRPTGKFVHHIIARPIGGIAPGYQPRVFPDGHSTKLVTGTKITWQMHYHKEPGPGTRVCDTDTAVAIRFYQPGEVITRLVDGDGMAVRGLRIPPGEANYSNEAEFTFEKDGYITGFNPHMHLRGKAAKFVATFPDGREQLLLDVPAYDFNWQHSYTYRDPVFAPKGTKVHMTLWWDNSAGNLANPDPTAEVTWGQPTTAEMGLGFMKYIEAEPVHIVVGQEEGEASATGGGR
jgi:mono/diheme cytochrome c family protein